MPMLLVSHLANVGLCIGDVVHGVFAALRATQVIILSLIDRIQFMLPSP
jgi:hypothetical protein